MICLAGSIPLIAASWKPIGPFGGSASVVQVDRHQPGTVVAATSNAQLFASTDDGDSWKALPFPAQLRATLHAFVIDPWHAGVYLAALSSDTDAYSGIFRTFDAGQTWKRLADPRLKAVWSVTYYPQDPRVIAAGTEDGLFQSRDGGDTWDELTSPQTIEMKPIVSITFDPADHNIIYAGTPHLPWKTTDGGATWFSIRKGMLDDSDVFSILVDDRLRRRLFASTCGGIYRSLDGGVQWTQLNRPEDASYRTFFISQHPRKPNVLFAGTAAGLIRSLDSGFTWHSLSTTSTRSIAFDPQHDDRVFIATDDSGLFRSDHLGDSMEAINNGFANRSFGSLATAEGVLYVTLNDLGSWNVRGLSAEGIWRGTPFGVDAILIGAQNVVGSESGLMYALKETDLLVFSDQLNVWVALPTPTESRVKALPYVSADGETIVIAMDDGVFQTTDAGQTWKAAQCREPDHVTGDARDIDLYEAVKIGDTTLLAASSHGLVISTDMGQSWRLERSMFGTDSVKALYQHPTRRELLFASQYGVVFFSSDNGRDWKPLSIGDENGAAIKSLAILPECPDRLFILVQSRGVYELTLPAELIDDGREVAFTKHPLSQEEH